MGEKSLPCIDCEIETAGFEYYMVHNSVWEEEAGLKLDAGCLCVSCLEGRIGRTLTMEDFPDCPLNRLNGQGIWSQSEQLLDRLTREGVR